MSWDELPDQAVSQIIARLELLDTVSLLCSSKRVWDLNISAGR